MKKNLFLSLLLFITTSLSAQQTIQRVEGSPYPYSAIPDKLYLTSETAYSYSQKIALQSLQGILAKTKPEILRDTHNHRAIVGKYIPIDVTYYSNFQGLLTKYASRLTGYILCDAKQNSTNVAFSLGGILNAVAIPADIESTAIAAGLTKLLDVRGKDETWALANYGTQFSKTIASYQNVSDDRGLYLGDFSTYAGAFQFWDDSSTGTLATSVYNRMNPGATFFGWGAGEYATVEQLSKKSMVIHPADFSPNLSTLCNVPVAMPRQKEAVTPYKVVPNVHTVCFVISDGDNIQWLSGSSDNLSSWANPNRTRLNLGWTISPALVELAPSLYRKYIENSPTTSECRNVLVAAPSGVGYYFPGIYPNLANECDLLNRYMKKADLGIVNILDVDLGAHNPNQYLRQSNIDALFYYTYGANYTGMNGKISWYKDKPSIGGRYTLWGTLSAPDALAAKLNVASTNINSEAGYSLIPVHIWSRNPTDVLECIKLLNPNVRVVAPDEFVWLIRKNIKGLNLGTGNGLKANYYKGADFDTLKYTQNDSKIDFEWGQLSPNSAVLGNDNFSVKWSGQIQPVYSEKYTFYSTAEDGVRLTINGRMLVDTLNANGQGIYSDTITLKSGVKYDIQVEYKERTGNATCELEWESASQVRQFVPRTQLYARSLPGTGLITAWSDCKLSGFSIGLKVGNYNQAALNALGMYDKDISSIKIPDGYKVLLYENDNFTGTPKEITATDSCLSDWNDRTVSLQVKSNGLTNMSGTWFLQNKSSKLYMEVTGGYTAVDDGVKLEQYSGTFTTNEQFKFTHLGDGTYSITAMHSGKSLDVEGFSQIDGTNVQQWSNYGSVNQQFIVLQGTDGCYKLMAKHSGKIIETASSVSQAAVRQYNDYGQSKGQWKFVAVPALVNSNGNGLSAEYFNGMNFETSRFATTDTTINFNWGTSAPYNKTNADQFSVRWEGKIQPRFTGNYTFYINSDNGRRLWINDQLIIDKWLSDYGIEYSGSISLTANQKYNIKLEYFEDAGGADCKLEWMNQLQPRQVVPKSQLFTKNFTAVDETVYQKINIVPNPVTNGILHINMTDFTYQEPLKVRIYDTVGNLKMETNLSGSNSIQLQNLPNGLYLVNFQNSDTNITKRLIIK